MKTIVQGTILKVSNEEGKPFIMIKITDNVSKVQEYINSQARKDYVPLKPSQSKDGVVEEGVYVLTARTKYQVVTVNAARKPISFDDLKRGDLVNIQITLAPSKKPSSKEVGISSYLNAVQLVKKGEGYNEFAVIEEDPDDTASDDNVTETPNW